MKTIAITFHVPEDVQKRLAKLAADNERSVSGELRVAIRNHLDSEKSVRDEG
jgi:predicted transcriptional regulator